MEALADMDAVPSWSPLHKRVEVVDRYPDGLPHHVKNDDQSSGIIDTEVVEYHWGPTGWCGMPTEDRPATCAAWRIRAAA